MAADLISDSSERARFYVYRFITENRFKEAVKSSSSTMSLLRKIQEAGKKVPKARATLVTRSVDDWFDNYKRQIRWDVEQGERVCTIYAAAGEQERAKLKSELSLVIPEINIEIGLVELLINR